MTKQLNIRLLGIMLVLFASVLFVNNAYAEEVSSTDTTPTQTENTENLTPNDTTPSEVVSEPTLVTPIEDSTPTNTEETSNFETASIETTGDILPTDLPTLQVECSNIMPTGSVSGANAVLIVPEGACPITVTFASYSHTGHIRPLQDQVLVDHITDTYGPGTHNIGPLNLSCNWQTDLYTGEVQPNLLPPPYTDGTPHGLTTGTVLFNADWVEEQVCNGGNDAVTVDVKINGVDGPVQITNGDHYVYSWTSTNATACQELTPENTPVALNGTSGNIGPNSGYYPSSSTSTTITIKCSNATSEATDSATVSLNLPNPNCTVMMPTGTVNFGMATLVVPQGACPIMVSFSSYTFATTIVPYDQQILVDNITDVYGPGIYQIGPLELRCNWQTDLYVGPVQEHLLAVGGHDQTQGPVLGYNYMENQVCGNGNIIVTKVVINDDDGTKVVSDFPLFVGTTTVTSGATTTLPLGTYTVSETYDSSEYSQSFSGDCDSNGNITLSGSSIKTCVITNNDTHDNGGGGGGGGSSRHRSRSRGIVVANNPQPEPQVLGIEIETPGLPNTGLGPITHNSGTNDLGLMIALGTLTLLGLNLLAFRSLKR